MWLQKNKACVKANIFFVKFAQFPDLSHLLAQQFHSLSVGVERLDAVVVPRPADHIWLWPQRGRAGFCMSVLACWLPGCSPA